MYLNAFFEDEPSVAYHQQGQLPADCGCPPDCPCPRVVWTLTETEDPEAYWSVDYLGLRYVYEFYLEGNDGPNPRPNLPRSCRYTIVDDFMVIQSPEPIDLEGAETLILSKSLIS